jgi:RNA polymerase sigma factor (sigma-70 family)
MDTSDRNDDELVRLAAASDTDAFNLLVERWERTILGLCYRVLGREEDAKDVCQEAFLRAYRGLGHFKGQAKFSSWLYRIALNLCRDWLRRERLQGLIDENERRHQQELALWLTDFAREFDMQRLADQRRVHNELGALEQYADYLVRASDEGR